MLFPYEGRRKEGQYFVELVRDHRDGKGWYVSLQAEDPGTSPVRRKNNFYGFIRVRVVTWWKSVAHYHE